MIHNTRRIYDILLFFNIYLLKIDKFILFYDETIFYGIRLLYLNIRV